MNPLLTLEWSRPNQPRHKLELTYSDDSWRRRESSYTNEEWIPIGSEVIQTPTITIASPITNWTSPNPLVAYFPDQEAAVATHPAGLRYYATRSRHWHPIDGHGLTHLITHEGPPELRPLSSTPFDRQQFEQNDDCETDQLRHETSYADSIEHLAAVTDTLQNRISSDTTLPTSTKQRATAALQNVHILLSPLNETLSTNE